LPRQEGEITVGYNVHPTIFAQDQTKSLNGDKSIMENVTEKCPKKTESEIRRFLGAFLFSNDDVHKKVKVLSGGEKNRVGMVCVLLQDANFLLLDEPTNHLDIPSKENLLAALKAYKGTILFVSHDHDFINEISNRILELTPDGVHSYFGNYESYLYQKSHSESLKPGATKAPSTLHDNPTESKKQVSDDSAKQIKRLEGKIAATEQKVVNVQERLTKLEFGTPNFDQETKLLNKLKRELQEFAVEWEALHKE
jgi:ATP-binding cassette subfamily F protein 3